MTINKKKIVSSNKTNNHLEYWHQYEKITIHFEEEKNYVIKQKMDKKRHQYCVVT